MATVTRTVRSGTQDIDALLADYQWSSFQGILYYSFPRRGSDFSGYPDMSEPDFNYGQLSNAQQSAVIQILTSLERYTNYLNLWSSETFQHPAGEATFRFGMTDATDTAHAYTPETYEEAGDVWFNKSSGEYATPVRGNYAYFTFLHEVGHAFGLKHPHETDVFGAMSLAHDNMNYTVMSYRSYHAMGLEDGYPNGDWGFPQTYMMYDIAALQHMYGADFGTNGGDTLYNWNPANGYLSVNGSVSIAPGANVVFMTLWDGGGIDTYDFSGYTSALTVSLIPGDWTITAQSQLADLGDGHFALGNVANALLYRGDIRSLIENATGGAGNDRLTGNQAANTLDGGAGDDILDGGTGADRLIGGAGSDLFKIDHAGDVIVELDGFGEGHDSADIKVATYTLGDNVEGAFGVSTTGAQNITGNASDNTIFANTFSGNVLTGGEGADTLTSFAGADRLIGGGGADRLYGNGGVDVLEGGDGNDQIDGGTEGDTIRGGAGVDIINGEDGADFIFGDAGADSINGGTGVDTIDGGEDDDQIAGGDQADTLAGGGGADTIHGGNDSDGITGGTGADRLYGGYDSDTIDGGDGNDVIEGGGHADTLRGEAGDDHLFADSAPAIDPISGAPRPPESVDFLGVDVLNGGAGADLIETGSGDDRIVYLAIADSLEASMDRIRHFESGKDKIDLSTLPVISVTWSELVDPGDGSIYSLVSVATNGATMKIRVDGRVASSDFLIPATPPPLIGTEGDDLLVGGDRADNITGNGGNDILQGLGASDQLNGGTGNDMLDGGPGADSMRGGDGDDVYVIDDGGDSVTEFFNGGFDEIRTAFASFTLNGISNVEKLTGLGSDGQSLSGNTGNNVIDGGLGADAMTGDMGDDVYFVDNIGDTVTEFAGQGSDEIRTDLSSYSLAGLPDVEKLTGLGSGGQSLTGNAADNIIDGGLGADAMFGGTGNDVYHVDNAGDAVTELAGEGFDEIRTALSVYTLPGQVEKLVGTSLGNQDLRGNADDNLVIGGAGNDLLRLYDGGIDTVQGGAGNDAILFGATMNGSDSANGGSGRDVLAIQGNYPSLVLGFSSLVNIETLSLLPSIDPRFGGSGPAPFSYSITVLNAAVAAGTQLIVNASTLEAGENLNFRGGEEIDGTFFIYGGRGTDTLAGGSGADIFFFAEGRYAGSDFVDGGGGADILVLRGDYALTLGAGSMTNIETVTLMSASDTRFFQGGSNYNYAITTHDGNVATGATMTFNGGKLQASEVLNFDGSAESGGHLRVFGGNAVDSIRTGGGNDFIYGGLEGDYLSSGGGADIFSYRSALEATGWDYDRIDGFDFSQDKLDLAGVHDGFGRVDGGLLRNFELNQDLEAAMAGVLTPGKAMFFAPDQGALAGTLFLVVDQNGVDGYQAGEDYVFQFLNTAPPPVIPDFII